MAINRATLLGNVGKDPDIRSTQSGSKVASFPLATSESWKDKATGEKKEAVQWHNIVVWNQNLIPIIEQYVRKGSPLYVEGKIVTRKWQDDKGIDRWTTEIVLQDFDAKIQLLGKREGSGKPPAQEEPPPGRTVTGQQSGNGGQAPASNGHAPGYTYNEEIPF